ncbi:MAG: BMC domain-containing protein [Proteobacteria bacterium]|nr:BMC domain-containing protein [Pseudomonadota bacterium]
MAEAITGPALALLDIGEIPRGLRALDGLIKEAEVEIIGAGTVQGCRYLIMFAGEVEPVQRSLVRAKEIGAETLVDTVLLPYAEERIVPAIRDGTVRWPAPGDTLGMVQTSTPSTMLRAVEAGLKGALVELVQLRICDGLHGKAIAAFWGETHDVEAAIELAEIAIGRGVFDGFRTEIIRRADPAVVEALIPGSTFFKEWRG